MDATTCDWKIPNGCANDGGDGEKAPNGCANGDAMGWRGCEGDAMDLNQCGDSDDEVAPKDAAVEDEVPCGKDQNEAPRVEVAAAGDGHQVQVAAVADKAGGDSGHQALVPVAVEVVHSEEEAEEGYHPAFRRKRSC